MIDEAQAFVGGINICADNLSSDGEILKGIRWDLALHATGTIVENSIYFRKRKLPKPGKYVFQLEQGITNSLVDEVLDVGLLVEEVVAP